MRRTNKRREKKWSAQRYTKGKSRGRSLGMMSPKKYRRHKSPTGARVYHSSVTEKRERTGGWKLDKRPGESLYQAKLNAYDMSGIRGSGGGKMIGG